MNDQIVPKLKTPEQVLDRLQVLLPDLTPELKKAAGCLLEDQQMIGVYSARHMAKRAEVKPNTMVRLAKELGFSGYEALRHLFQTAIEQAEPGFQDRARWLQSLPKKGELGRLYADMASVAIRNIETTLASSDATQMEQAALALHHAKK